jgi:predicted acetyltransferase
VAEFFVVRGARRRGVGTRAAHAVFGRFPGAWEVRVRKENVAAMAFWARAMDGWAHRAVTCGPLSLEGVDWNVFRIEPTRR